MYWEKETLMKGVGFLLVVLSGLLGAFGQAAAEVSWWRFGGGEGQAWKDWTALSIMMDDHSVRGAIQPWELKPDENLLPSLGPWYRWKFPKDIHYRVGTPRIWLGINETHPASVDPTPFVDGDPATYQAYIDAYSSWWNALYTIDMGTVVPVERFVFYPPEGNYPLTGEPFRPNFVLKKFELSGSKDYLKVQNEEGDSFRPLDFVLARVEQNFEPITEVRFPPQHLQFLRLQTFPNTVVYGINTSQAANVIDRLAFAEMEVYGRGFVPQAIWESQVIDLGHEVNFGRVAWGLSRWRKEGEQLVPAPQASTAVRVELKTGHDDTPVAYFGFTDMGEPEEVSEAEYLRLEPRVRSGDPQTIGWQGSITEDRKNWGFWSAPLRVSGERSAVPRGRFFLVRVQLETKELWEFARMDSLMVEISSLLAERILGEVAVAGDLQPQGGRVQVRAGEMTEFVFELGAEFSGGAQSGFDAVRIFPPAGGGEFRSLEMGFPLTPVAPDEVVSEAQGFSVYLPRRMSQDGDRRLRLRLASAVYGASGEFRAEVFERVSASLPQRVEAGDVSLEIKTNQLRVMAIESSLGAVLEAVEVQPSVFTPQGDGVNDRVQIGYTLFRVLAAAEVEVGVYTLEGKRVWQKRLGTKGPGHHTVVWDGQDDQGQVVKPGLYLARVGVETDEGRFERVRIIAVAY